MQPGLIGPTIVPLIREVVSVQSEGDKRDKLLLRVESNLTAIES